MKVFCDTSVLVAGCVRKHPHFTRARAVLESVVKGTDEGVISTHSLAECFSALTSLPIDPRILPVEAERLIARNMRRHFQVIPVGEAAYDRAIRNCADRSLGRGKVYDALLLECARTSDPDRIYTFNVHDFHLLAPDLADRICAP